LDAERLLRWRVSLLALGCVFLASACSLEASDGYDAKAVERFDYSNFENVPLEMQMVDTSGKGLVGVQVTIRRASTLPFDDPEYIPGEVLFRGRSGVDGQVSMPVAFPAGLETVEVVSQLKGYQGNFSEPKMLEDWGAFAPSSIVKLELDELASFRMLLAEKVR
jgi:hypothetical protein